MSRRKKRARSSSKAYCPPCSNGQIRWRLRRAGRRELNKKAALGRNPERRSVVERTDGAKARNGLAASLNECTEAMERPGRIGKSMRLYYRIFLAASMSGNPGQSRTMKRQTGALTLSAACRCLEYLHYGALELAKNSLERSLVPFRIDPIEKASAERMLLSYMHFSFCAATPARMYRLTMRPRESRHK